MTALPNSSRPSELLRLTPNNPVAELFDSLRLWRLWSMMGVNDIRQRYRNSVLGPLWLASGLGITIIGISLLYSQIMRVSFTEFAPFLTAGLMVWTFISALAVESCAGYYSAEGLIKSLQVPYFVYIFRVVCRNVIVLAHNIAVLLIVYTAFGRIMGIHVPQVLAGFALLILFSVGMCAAFSAIGTMFKDFSQIVAQVFQLLVFLTPVFWMPTALSHRREFLHYNPFFYLLEVIREPLLGQSPVPNLWVGAVGVTLASLLVGFISYAVSRKSIVFYL